MFHMCLVFRCKGSKKIVICNKASCVIICVTKIDNSTKVLMIIRIARSDSPRKRLPLHAFIGLLV